MDTDYKFILLHKIFELIHKIVLYVLIAFLAYMAYLTVDSLAGKTTIANVFIQYFAGKGNYGLPWILALFLFIWATLEKRFRKNKTIYFQARIKELETRIDPKRSSSDLSPNSDTKPEDAHL